MRRVDPQKRTLGRFFAEEIAAPLGLEIYFGAPDDLPRERLARIERVPAWKALPQARDLPRPMALAMLNPRSLSAFGRSPTRACDGRPTSTAPNTAVSSSRRAARSARLGTSRAPTRHSSPSRPSSGLTAATLDELTRPPIPPRHGWHDQVLKVDTAFSLGFARPLGEFRFGSSASGLRPSRRRRLVRVRGPRPRRVLRIRNEPARLPAQQRPAEKCAARRAVPLPGRPVKTRPPRVALRCGRAVASAHEKNPRPTTCRVGRARAGGVGPGRRANPVRSRVELERLRLELDDQPLPG